MPSALSDRSMTPFNSVCKYNCTYRTAHLLSLACLVFQTDYWLHQRLHIKEERRLECTKCPFVTEYRHHLEYHIRNHLGSKPYKCSKCNYECVNKSMLNSHMKSHTNVYQYRCANCSYATKYCHSLKMHLSKHNHSRAVMLNVDGSLPTEGRDNPGDSMTKSKSLPMINNMISPLSSANNMLPFGDPGLCNLPPLSLISLLPNSKQMLSQVFSRNFPNQPPYKQFESLPPTLPIPSSLAAMASFMLSMQSKAFPLVDDLYNTKPTSTEPVDVDKVLDLSSHKSKTSPKPEEPYEFSPARESQSQARNECPFCEIIFKNEAFFDIHMRFHNPSNPFLCNRCGLQSKNQIDFFRHLSEKEHEKDWVMKMNTVQPHLQITRPLV